MAEEWDPKRWFAGRVAWEGTLAALRRRAGILDRPAPRLPLRKPLAPIARTSSSARPALLRRPTTAA